MEFSISVQDNVFHGHIILDLLDDSIGAKPVGTALWKVVRGLFARVEENQIARLVLEMLRSRAARSSARVVWSLLETSLIWRRFSSSSLKMLAALAPVARESISGREDRFASSVPGLCCSGVYLPVSSVGYDTR